MTGISQIVSEFVTKKVLSLKSDLLSPSPKALWRQFHLSSPCGHARRGKFIGVEKNKATVCHAVEEIFNKQNPDAADKYHTADFINHDPNLPQIRSLEEYKQWIGALKTAYPLPGYRVITEDIIAEGDRVVIRWSCESTGKEAIFTGATVYRLVGGKIAECWWIYDMLGVLQQVGVIPAIAQRQEWV